MSAFFDDNLYGGSEVLAKFGGCGLFGCSDAARFVYERHAARCEPGKWFVSIAGGSSQDIDEFLPIYGAASAVVDDFGTLRRVEA